LDEGAQTSFGGGVSGPAPEEGAIFKKDWFKQYGGPIECTRTVFSLDCAFKTGKENDYSVIAVISDAKTDFHIRLVSRGRWEFPELKRQAVALADIWRPTAVLIEDAASGQSLIQALKSETRLPILPVKPQGDKVSRAHAVSPLVESGKVCVPDAAPWLNDFIEEVISFPAAPHDDMVDAFTQVLSYLRGSGWDSESFQEMGRQMIAYDAQRRRGAPGYGRMINNVNDMLDYEDGTVDGVRYTLPSRLSRIRGAW
jgi:predicted phage terminase large subunit-like protein